MLLVGCPIHRSWMYREWIDYLERAIDEAGIPKWGLCFVAHPDDTDTLLSVELLSGSIPTTVVTQSQHTRLSQRRSWVPERLHDMVLLRNMLLREVRKQKPDLFLSLDSDILLNPQSIKGALEGLDKFDAVGMKTYLSVNGKDTPNYASRYSPSGGLSRPDFDGFARVPIIMAIKLMTPAAYKVNYAYDYNGEDIGWSVACREEGLKLGFDGRFPSKHVMEPEQLWRVDVRCGF